MVFYRGTCARLEPWPDYVRRAFAKLAENPGVDYTMNGPSEVPCRLSHQGTGTSSTGGATQVIMTAPTTTSTVPASTRVRTAFFILSLAPHRIRSTLSLKGLSLIWTESCISSRNRARCGSGTTRINLVTLPPATLSRRRPSRATVSSLRSSSVARLTPLRVNP